MFIFICVTCMLWLVQFSRKKKEPRYIVPYRSYKRIIADLHEIIKSGLQSEKGVVN